MFKLSTCHIFLNYPGKPPVDSCMTDPDSYPGTTSAESTNETTTTTTTANSQQPRRLLRFVKNEPGHRVSVTVNLLFFLNGILFAVFSVMSILMPSGTPDEHFDVIVILGGFLFCMWNSIVFTMIILFPSITTINREKVHWIFFPYPNSFFCIFRIYFTFI